jgi:hypothetical protein
MNVPASSWRHVASYIRWQKNIQPLCRLKCMVVTQLIRWWSWWYSWQFTTIDFPSFFFSHVPKYFISLNLFLLNLILIFFNYFFYINFTLSLYLEFVCFCVSKAFLFYFFLCFNFFLVYSDYLGVLILKIKKYYFNIF